VGITSATGAYFHYARGGHLDLRIGLLFGFAGLAGAYIGSRLSVHVSEQILLLLFASLMLVISLSLLVRRSTEPAVRKASKATSIFAGVLIGFLTGFLGVGGGFLIVPALILLAGLDIRTAIGTSLLVISMNCAAGFVGHLHSSSLDLRLTLLVSSLAFSGLVAGTLLSKFASPANLKRSFATFVLVVGLTMFVANL
jgi:uncharacterized membrane protein YfcA